MLCLLLMPLALSSVVALGANVICNKIPGLSPNQRTICQGRPDAVAMAGVGGSIALNECRYQFRNQRWNCTHVNHRTADAILGHAHRQGTSEAAFAHAIHTAGVAFAITKACSQGNLTSCGCDREKLGTRSSQSSLSPSDTPSHGWKWGGCSADISYGLKFARRFVDAREVEEGARRLMNLHNNRAGRKSLKKHMVKQCKCHGTSGSCSMQTCWNTLPPFRSIGDNLLKHYKRAKQVAPIRSAPSNTAVFIKEIEGPQNGGVSKNTKPRRSQLVYLDESPTYCNYDAVTGFPGTQGRVCNKTRRAEDSCQLLCCGRGFNTRQYTRQWQCHCKFHWCCSVTCQLCSEKTQVYTCK